ncbi:hypothetical protein B0H13DRAFT_2349463 [Mycena leptocephala]|nr:hypothetical protein B0H13DRAFT_2349463 [Mycena leptocephala]
MPPHIKHKQKAVFPIQFSSHLKLAQDPELPPLPIDWSYTPHLLEARWMTAVVSAVSAYRCVYLLLVSTAFRYAPFQTLSRCLSCHGKCAAADDFDPMKPPPTPHSRPTASASAPLRHHCAHFHSIALAFSLPVLAAMPAFVTYTETSKQFDVAVLFASSSLFRLLRQPTMFLPRTLFAIADIHNALAPPLARLPRAVCGRSGAGGGGVGEGAGWVWEEKANGKKEKKGGEKEKQTKRSTHTNLTNNRPSRCTTSHSPSRAARSPPLLGAWGAAGRVSWRASLGDALHRHRGKWEFGGTVMDNVLFGQPFEEDRYWRVIEDLYLLPDLQLLADEDLTEVCVGEKGINLSGESLPDIRFRILIADSTRRWTEAARERRPALYYGADVVILMTRFPLILDANVGKALFRSAIQGLVAQGKTFSSRRYPSLSRAGASLPGSIASLGGEGEDAGGRARGRRGRDEAQDLTEDPAIVVKRMELAQRMKMLEGVRKDLVAFEK